MRSTSATPATRATRCAGARSSAPRRRGMSAYQGHGSVATPHGILITWALMIEGGIQVNERGERFANEHVGYSEACLPVLRQPGGVAWCVYDERLHQLGMTFPDYQEAHRAGAVKMDPSFPRLNETLREVRAAMRPEGRIRSAGAFSSKPALAAALLRNKSHRRAVPYPGRPGGERTRAGAGPGRQAAARTSSPAAARPAACRATTSGATSPATACSARWSSAASPARELRLEDSSVLLLSAADDRRSAARRSIAS